MIILPLPNFYSSKPCYYPHRVYDDARGRYLIDPRSKEYPDFNTVVHAHLIALWNSGGNNDAIRMYSSNKAYGQLWKIYQSTPSMHQGGHFTGLHAALTAWERTSKADLMKLNWKPISGISTVFRQGEFLMRRRSAK